MGSTKYCSLKSPKDQNSCDMCVLYYCFPKIFARFSFILETLDKVDYFICQNSSWEIHYYHNWSRLARSGRNWADFGHKFLARGRTRSKMARNTGLRRGFFYLNLGPDRKVALARDGPLFLGQSPTLFGPWSPLL